jgi:D-alanyl-lipoteichoic acid acyltransferase DltB (MBOAT superfamily)
MMPQFSNPRKLVRNYRNIFAGSFIFSAGLFKKIVIADSFAIFATHGFDNALTLTTLESWVTSLSYTFQLYFDFSGYTDMAIGAALLFNIKLPINFNSPYKAVNIQDFWRRWHITLSRFLRDYIYIPLGGNRKGKFFTYFNLMFTFVVGGFWHGAGWTFIIWGALHGSALIIHRIWSDTGIKINVFISWFITFNFINVTWVFFRAETWNDAINILYLMFGVRSVDGFSFLEVITKIDVPFMLVIMIGSIVGCFCLNNLNFLHKKISPSVGYQILFVLIMLVDLLYIGSIQPKEFLYFDF